MHSTTAGGEAGAHPSGLPQASVALESNSNSQFQLAPLAVPPFLPLPQSGA